MITQNRRRSYSARANIMVALGSAFYFFFLLAALYVMDRQVYSAAKLEIVRDNFLEIFQLPENLNEQARSALYSVSETGRLADQEKLKASLEDIVNGPTSMMRMSLIDSAGNVIISVENLSKAVTMNTWNNNLFIREFSGRTSQNVSPRRFDSEFVGKTGHLVGTYTSPTGVEDITLLTQRYRQYAAAMILAWLATWLLIYEYLLRPVRNVTLHLDISRRDTPSLIPSARGALERGYNELASSALLQLIEEKLTTAARPGHQRKPVNRQVVIQEALTLAGNGFQADRFRVAVSDSGSMDDGLREEYQWSVAPEAPGQFLPSSPKASGGEVHLLPYEDGSGFHYQAPLANGFIHVDCHYRKSQSRSKTYHENLVRVCNAFRSGFVAFQAYSEQLFRERSEANISLARNMGHDLTNIIATSKLELMGIRRILENIGSETTLPQMKVDILSDGVHGLLKSTRLLQEMVNIYRSFSYVKRPAYERRALAPLVEEFLEMFEPILSANVRIERHINETVPAPIIEPRLIKLALFNVLQNAVDMLNRYDRLKAGEGVVRVVITWESSSDLYEVRIEDNGPGICDETGHLLSLTEAQAIFDYGYSTKGESGEGLGLNWVQTIMSDFHDGGVRAENRVEGGAAIIMWFRSMERKEARIKPGADDRPKGHGNTL